MRTTTMSALEVDRSGASVKVRAVAGGEPLLLNIDAGLGNVLIYLTAEEARTLAAMLDAAAAVSAMDAS